MLKSSIAFFQSNCKGLSLLGVYFVQLLRENDCVWSDIGYVETFMQFSGTQCGRCTCRNLLWLNNSWSKDWSVCNRERKTKVSLLLGVVLKLVTCITIARARSYTLNPFFQIHHFGAVHLRSCLLWEESKERAYLEFLDTFCFITHILTKNSFSYWWFLVESLEEMVHSSRRFFLYDDMLWQRSSILLFSGFYIILHVHFLHHFPICF